MRRIYAESAEAALVLEIDALLPVVAAMAPGDGDRASLLERVLERIIERVVPDAQRVLMLDQAATGPSISLPVAAVLATATDIATSAGRSAGNRDRHRYLCRPQCW